MEQKELKELIKNGRTSEAIEQILKRLSENNEYYDKFISLQGQWKTAESRIDLGLSDFDTMSKKFNRITESVLKYLSHLKSEYKIGNKHRETGGYWEWHSDHKERFKNIDICNILIKHGKKISLLPSEKKQPDILMNEEYWWFKSLSRKCLSRDIQRCLQVGKNFAPNILCMINNPNSKIHEITFGIYNFLKFDESNKIKKVTILFKNKERLIEITEENIENKNFPSKFYTKTKVGKE